MNRWKCYAAGWTVWLAMGLLTSCAPGNVKNKAALCTVRFELSDPALESLSAGNLRAVALFEAACGRIKLP